jgi:hypothetical protein
MNSFDSALIVDIQNKCGDLNDSIDSKVYKSKIRRGGLYGLTEEEIKIVEE